MTETAQTIMRQWDEVAAGRAPFQSVWQEIADHLLGRRDFVTSASPGRKRMARIYDTTGLQAADLLAAALHSFLTNPALRWFALRPEDGALAEDEAVRLWLSEAEDALYAAFNTPEGNFAPQIHEVYLDQVAFGTAALYVGDRPGRGILFSARPLGEIHIAENAEGRVDTVFRREWGEAFDAQIDMANRAFAAAFGEHVDDVRQLQLTNGQYLGDHPDMVRAFAKLGGLMGEAAFIGGQEARIGRSSSEARAQLSALEADAEFRTALLDRAHPEHRQAVARRSDLARAAYGDDTGHFDE